MIQLIADLKQPATRSLDGSGILHAAELFSPWPL
jgi:hypothetical protein